MIVNCVGGNKLVVANKIHSLSLASLINIVTKVQINIYWCVEVFVERQI